MGVIIDPVKRKVVVTMELEISTPIDISMQLSDFSFDDIRESIEYALDGSRDASYLKASNIQIVIKEKLE